MLNFIKLEDLHTVLNVVVLLQLLNLCQMQKPQNELESHLPYRFPQQEQSHDLQECQPIQVTILTESSDDTAEAQHFWIELKLAHEDTTADFYFILVSISFQVAVLSLNRGEEESLEQSDHELLLIRVNDVELTEARVRCYDSGIDSAIKILNRHEVFNYSLAETIAEELEPNYVSFLERLSIEFATIANRFRDYIDVLRLLRFEAAPCTSHSVDDCVSILNFFSCLKLLLGRC